MTDFTEIDGVGPSRAEDLDERFDSFEELAEADHEELAEMLPMVSQDSALDFVVQAQNIVSGGEDDAEGETSDEDEESTEDVSPADVSDMAEAGESDEESSEPESSEDESFDETVEMTDLEQDLVVAAVVGDVANVYNSNPPRKAAGMKLLEQLRTQDGGEVTFDGITRMELNTLHSAVRQLKNEFQGRNIIEYMDALANVERRVNEIRNRR